MAFSLMEIIHFLVRSQVSMEHAADHGGLDEARGSDCATGEGETAQSSSTVPLYPMGTSLRQALPSWDDVAFAQSTITTELLEKASQGAYFALEDRNSYAHPWRKIFAVREGDYYCIYDSQGQMINEPAEGVTDGKHSVLGVVEEFDDYYRPPKVRHPPRQRRSLPPTPSRSVREAPPVPDEAPDETLDTDTVLMAPEATPTPAPADATPAPNPSGAPASAHSTSRDRSPVHSIVASPISTGGSPQCADPTYRIEHLAHYPSSADEGVMGECTSEEEEEVDTSKTAGAAADTAPAVSTALAATITAPAASQGAASDASPAGVGAAESQVRWTPLELDRIELLEPLDPTTRSGGMVAQVTPQNVLVVTDMLKWVQIPTAQCSERLQPETLMHARISTAPEVMAFTYGAQTRSTVTGVLLGCKPEFIFDGAIPAYMAHYTRPQQFGGRTRQQSQHVSRADADQSFAFGDIVCSVADESVRAVVARVAYKPKIGSAQARKYLVLLEVVNGPNMTALNPPPQLFPATWNQWRRVSMLQDGTWGELNPNDFNAPVLTLAETDMTYLMQVHHMLYTHVQPLQIHSHLR